MPFFDFLGVLPFFMGCLMTPSTALALVHDWHRVLARSAVAFQQKNFTLTRTRAVALYPKKSRAQLPVDVLHRIMEFAYFDYDLQPDRKLMRRCALVCKEWSSIVQPLLFKHVQLRSHSDFESFASAVVQGGDGQRCSRLANSVARLHVILDHDSTDALPMMSAVQAILLCPALFELEVSILGLASGHSDSGTNQDAAMEEAQVPPLEPDVLAMLNCGPQISALRVNNWSGNDETTFQLLSMWPTLTSVFLTGLPPSLKSVDSSEATIPPSPCLLQEVHLEFDSPPSLSFVEWLLQNSTLSLRSLHLEREAAPEFVKQLISKHKSSLLSLTLFACTDPGLASLIQECTELKELQFMDPHVSPLLLKKLPGALEHLALSVNRDTMLHAAVDGVNAASHLRRLTVEVQPGGRSHPSLASFKIACALNGLSFVRTSSVRAYHATIRGDPLPVVSFPRTKQLANLKAMLAISRSKKRVALTSPYAVNAGNRETSVQTHMSPIDEMERKSMLKLAPEGISAEERTVEVIYG